MDNILLGRTIKAMYRLSGKTVQQLADESGLTVDTVNNLFYARLQKPGFAGVCDLTRACGFTVEELLDFMERHADTGETDLRNELGAYMLERRGDVPCEPPSSAPKKRRVTCLLAAALLLESAALAGLVLLSMAL